MKTIKIKYQDGVEKLVRNGDWIDLRAADNVFVPQGEYVLISLGVSMQIPEGYEAHVLPRSSTFKNYGIIMVNSMGIIDNSYCGDEDVWRFPAYCLSGKDILDGRVGTLIKKNDRICQFRIAKIMEEIEFEEVEMLHNESRGGIGSTGIK